MDIQIIQDCYAELAELRVQAHGTPNLARRIGGVMEKLQQFASGEPKCALVEMPAPAESMQDNGEPQSFIANPALVEDKKGKKK